MLEIDIEFVKSIARDAGEAALGRIGTFTVEYKADDSYVTAIDRDTEVFIRERLAARYPDFSFQGEEFGRHGDLDRPIWAVDPIDGTTNFVFGLPCWCVSIGLVEDGIPVAGAVYLPRTGEMFWGERDKGSYCSGIRLHPPDRQSTHPEDTLGFTSGAIKALDVTRITGRIRAMGSIASEAVYAAKGSLCSLVGCFEGANDLAAGFCIAHEAGCVVRYLTGETVQMRDMMVEGRTRAPFVLAPPSMAEMLIQELRPRQAAHALDGSV